MLVARVIGGMYVMLLELPSYYSPHTYTHLHTYIHTYTHTHTHLHAYTHTHTPTHIHTYTHMHAHTHTYKIYARAHTHSRAQATFRQEK